MNPAEFAHKLTSKTKLIILQYTFGIKPAREAILALAQSKNIPVLEDITHGFDPGLFQNDRFQTMKLLSFGRSKAFSSVFGGALVVHDATLSTKIEKRLTSLTSPATSVILRVLLYKILAMTIKSNYDIMLGKLLHKVFNALGLLIPEISRVEKRGEYDPKMEKNYPNCLATLLLHQLGKYEGILNRRAKATTIYSNFFINQKNIQGAPMSSKPLSRYPLLVNNRQRVLGSMMPQNIFLGTWYSQVIAPKEVDVQKLGYTPGSCPVAEHVSKHVINLPTNVSEEEAKKIVTLFHG